MNALRFGFRAVQDNLRSLAFYAALAVGISFLFFARRTFGDEPESLFTPESLLLQGFAAFAGAVAQTVAFTWMGQRLGKPLWKLELREGFHSFFGFWLCIQTVEAALWLLCIGVAERSNDGNLGLSLLMACMPVFVATTPLGACVMYQGSVTRHHLRNAAHILVDLLPQTLIIVLFSGGALFFSLVLSTSTVEWARPLVSVIAVYFDIVVFGAAWALCKFHEQSADDDTDLDF